MKTNHRMNLHKLSACFLAALVLLATTPPVFAGESAQPERRKLASAPIPPAPQPKGGVRRGPRNSVVIPAKFNLSDNPTDLEVLACLPFQDPLVPVSGPTLPGENAALAKALKAFKAKDDLQDLSALTAFIESNPKSRWTPSLEASVGSLKWMTGYLSDALSLWAAAWESAKDEQGQDQKTMASGAVANLVNFDARLGRKDELHKYLGEIENRPFFGTNEVKVKGARDGLYYMEHVPSKAFRCGPFAVNSLLYLNRKEKARDPILEKSESTSQGTTLAQVKGWADQVGLKYQMAKRAPGAAFVTPCVMHWKLNHFAAILGVDGGMYHIQDPTFDSDAQIWVSAKALEVETDGYFLIPATQALGSGWKTVSEEEAKTVYGRGTSTGRPAAPGTCTPEEACCNATGMAKAAALTPQATLTINDVPLHYSCPLGPSTKFSVCYNDLEGGQPSGSFTFSNLGADWSTNWVSYLTADATTKVATVRLRTGGIEIDTPTTLTPLVYPNNHQTEALLVNTGVKAYTRTLPDGTIETFDKADTAVPPHIFMSSVQDPSGQSCTITYDTHFRITAVTDALGQMSTFSYINNTFGNVGFYKIYQIHDPFNRFCTFAYDAATTTRLVSITDQIGLKSTFAYDASSSMITSMGTAYGVTSFYQYVPATPPPGNFPPLGLKTTYPDGTFSVVENWLGETKSTYVWDRHATQLYPNDPSNQVYTHCEVIKYLLDSVTNLEATGLQWVIHPLESLSPIYYLHPGQPGGNTDYAGTSDLPSQVTRTLGNEVVDATVAGTITAGDTITVGIQGSGINMPAYTVLSTDTASTLASTLASRINANLGPPPYTWQYYGVTAGAAGPIFSLHSDKFQGGSYFTATVTGAQTETVTFLSHVRQTAVGTMTGAIGVGDVVTITIGIHGGSTVSIPYTVAAGNTLSTIVNYFANDPINGINNNTTLQKLGVVATANGTTLNLVSYNPVIQTYGFGNNQAGGGHELLSFSSIRNGATVLENYQYNVYGLVTQAIDSLGRTFSFSYDTNNIDLLQKKETQGTDNFQLGAWTYNSHHSPLTQTDGSGRVTNYAYNYLNQLVKVTDANSNTTTMSYPTTYTATVGGTVSNNHIETITVHDPALSGGFKSVTYTEHTGDTLTTIAAGLAAAINADVNLQGIGVTATSSAAVITLSSTSVNATTYTKTVTGTITITISVSPTSFGYLTKIDGPLPGSQDVTTFSYDGFGREYTATDSEGYTKTFSYDDMDRRIQTTYLDTSTEQTVWDKLDPIMTKDRIGRWTQASYDTMDQLTYVIDPLGRKTQYTWCTCGAPLTLTDPVNHTTSWQHDLQGRTTQTILPDLTSISYIYESWTSKILSKTDALNQTTTYFYNPDDTGYQCNYTNAVNNTSPVTLLWDQNFMRRTSAQKNDWGTVSYTYNPFIVPLGAPTTGGGMLQLIHNTRMTNSDITFVYDVLGRATNQSINGVVNSDTLTFDAMSRVTAETNTLGNFSYAYVDDVSGSSKGTTRLASVTYPNSEVTKYGWYPAVNDERLQQIANLKSASGSTISQYSHLYDVSGQITQWQQLQNNSSLNFSLGYDQAGQLTSAQAGAGGPSAAYLNQSYFGYDQASNRTTVQTSSINRIKIGGAVTLGNTLTITVEDVGLTGGQEAVTYTVQSGDTLSTIAAGLAAAITADSNLQAIGVNASANAAVMSIKSASPRITTYVQSTSGGATETLTLGVTGNFVENAVIGGSKTTGDAVTITISDPALTGGQTAITYTVLSTDTLATIATGLKTAINANSGLSTQGITATVAGTAITIRSTSPNATTYAQSTSASATETVALSINQNGPQTIAIGGSKTTGNTITVTVYDAGLAGGLEVVPYTVLAGDTLASIASGLASAINADSNLQAIGISATSTATVVTLLSNSINATTLRETTSSGATETVALNIPANGIQTAAIGGMKTTGDTVTITTYDAGLAGGSEPVTYTVLAGDTIASIATGLAAAINADANLSNVGITAGAVSTVVNIRSVSINATTYTKSTSGGASETISLAPAASVSQYGYNNVDDLTSIAPGGAATFQGSTNKALKSATVNSTSATLNWAESFNGYATLSSGNNTVPVSATDGANNVKTNNYQIVATGPTSSTSVSDANGNMTSDGTNTYLWDVENRLIQVSYPGTGNNSQFLYDPLGRLSQIVETRSSSVTSTKQFVRCNSQICEERDGSSNLVKQFFAWGQTITGTNYYYTRDHLGSVRDMVDGSGNLVAHYEYRMYGEVMQTVGTISSDFQYCGYYAHIPSSLNLTLNRAYSSMFGRWISRDPSGVAGGGNTYAYVFDRPAALADPSGLDPDPVPIPLPKFSSNFGSSPGDLKRGCKDVVNKELGLGSGGGPDNVAHCWSGPWAMTRARQYKDSCPCDGAMWMKQGTFTYTPPCYTAPVSPTIFGPDGGNYNYVLFRNGSYIWMNHAAVLDPAGNVVPPKPGYGQDPQVGYSQSTPHYYPGYPDSIWCAACKRDKQK